MRIWSVHPKYLDSKGLIALWREALLAKKVLEGKTKGYKNHPQLKRFKNSNDALNCINQYLTSVYEEALNRGYNFSKNKINPNFSPTSLTVTNQQLKYEIKHLLKKLEARDPIRFHKLFRLNKIDSHPLFVIIKGEIENWEIINNS